MRLAGDFGCTKFQLFLYGRPLKMVTDHKNLESVFNKPTHTLDDPLDPDRGCMSGFVDYNSNKTYLNNQVTYKVMLRVVSKLDIKL